MRPETILQSDLLDILFENRNKAYGAYSLRKNYNKTLLKALGVTCTLVVLLVLLQSMKPEKKQTGGLLPPDVILTEVPLKKDPEPIEEKQQEKPKPKEKIKSVTNFEPDIKPDNEVVETTVHDQNTLTETNIADKPSDGEDATPGNAYNPSSTGEGGEGDPTPSKQPDFDEVTVREFADVMPSFNGDIVRFMVKNLRQPDDLENGEKVIVKVRFVVNANGEIDDVKIVQSGRSDLDKEVTRVVKKMPRWKPGMQGGRNVPVYFYLPVTFVGYSE